jgi:drug/metabolite transporter (DMT)-like permease
MALGILFSFLSALTLNSGNILQKRGVDALPAVSAARSAHLLRTLLSSRTWVLGLVLCGSGLLLQVLAFSLAPLAVVQSIFNAGIVTLILISRWRLGERLGRGEQLGVVTVVVSVICVSASLTDSSGPAASTGSQLRVLVAVVPTLVVAGLLVVRLRSSRGGSAFYYGAASGLIYGTASLGTKGASTLVRRYGLVHSIPHIVTSIYPYLFLVLAVTGMVIYQEGLQRFRVAVVGSMADVVSSTYLVAVGTVVFVEALPKNPAVLALRLVGFAGVLAGSILVALGGKGADLDDIPMADADIGLGSVLAAASHAGADELDGRSPSKEGVVGHRPTIEVRSSPLSRFRSSAPIVLLGRSPTSICRTRR